jgi:hypothetical protein
MTEATGWALLLLGVALAVRHLLGTVTLPGLLAPAAAIAGGLFAILAAHVARAVFDSAQDTRAMRLAQRSAPSAAVKTSGLRAEPSLRRPSAP